MGTVRVQHTIAGLRRDFEEMPVLFVERGARVVRKTIRKGRTAARGFARQTSPIHGVHYIAAITDEMTGPLEGEWGPDASMPQGEMLFEYGEGRQTAPHLSITKSRDAVGQQFADDVGDMLDRLFWP